MAVAGSPAYFENRTIPKTSLVLGGIRESATAKKPEAGYTLGE
jgi:hypothetical protein